VISGSASRRYAKALLRLGAAEGRIEALVGEIEALAGAYASSAELRDALDNPRMTEAERQSILQAVLDRAGASKTLRNAAILMLGRGRASLWPDVARALRVLADEHAGRQRAEVVSASPLAEGFYVKLVAELQRLTGRTIELERRTDPTLIGGVVTKVGDKVYDGTIRSRLEDMKESLQKT
jgi:F-type H+-transporting ATPase subunit delta